MTASVVLHCLCRNFVEYGKKLAIIQSKLPCHDTEQVHAHNIIDFFTKGNGIIVSFEPVELAMDNHQLSGRALVYLRNEFIGHAVGQPWSAGDGIEFADPRGSGSSAVLVQVGNDVCPDN